MNPRRSDALETFRVLSGRADVVFEAAGVRETIGLATSLTRNGEKFIIFSHHVEDEAVPTSEWYTRVIPRPSSRRISPGSFEPR